MFIKESLSKKEVMYKEIRLEDINQVEKIRTSIMYYDKVFIGICMGYDYRKLMELQSLEDKDIKLILLFDNVNDCAKSTSVLNRKDIKHILVSIKTIDEVKVKIYLDRYFSDMFSRSFSEKDIDSLYKYLFYKSNLNKELDTIGNMKTLKSIRDYIKYTSRVTPNTFAFRLLTGKIDREMYDFLLENSYRVNYLVAILSNTLDRCIKLYGLLKTSEYSSLGASEIYVNDDNINKKMKITEYRKCLELLKVRDFDYLYKLKMDISEASTKFKKQSIILGLIL